MDASRTTVDIASSDEALIEAYRDGQDALAYSELVRRYQIPLYRILAALLSDADHAEPACERLFVRAATRLHELTNPAGFHAWLIHMARDVANDVEVDAAVSAPLSRPQLLSAANLSLEAGKQVVSDAVRAALGQMSPQQRAMLTLVELEGNSPADVAKAMEVPLAEFEAELQEARRRFVDLVTAPGHTAPARDAPANARSVADLPALVGGRYRLGPRLGAGGMGVVHRARDEQTGNDVALKVVFLGPGTEDIRARFDRECVAMDMIEHPNFVRSFANGELPGARWIAIDLLEGRNLADRLVEGPLPLRRALEIAKQLLGALGQLHARGIVHRDVKSDNVLFASAGDESEVKLIDLGIAKLPQEKLSPEQARLTAAGMTLGTPAYISPEQAIGQVVDGRADLYSLSVLLFEMLTGKLPFRAGDVVTLLTMHVSATPPLISELTNGQLPMSEAVDELVDRGLAKTARDRYPDADAYIEAIDALLAAL
ncbi:MAG: protein kinase domain-containing protein [Nannocystaceae bacterium]|nr:protein kinase [bacterium]